MLAGAGSSHGSGHGYGGYGSGYGQYGGYGKQPVLGKKHGGGMGGAGMLTVGGKYSPPHSVSSLGPHTIPGL